MIMTKRPSRISKCSNSLAGVNCPGFLCSGPRILVKIAPIKSNKKQLYLCYNSNINPIVFCSLAVVLTICHLRDVRNTISGARQAQLSLSILMATCIWRNKIKIFASGMKLSNRVVSISPVTFLLVYH